MNKLPSGVLLRQAVSYYSALLIEHGWWD